MDSVRVVETDGTTANLITKQIIAEIEVGGDWIPLGGFTQTIVQPK